MKIGVPKEIKNRENRVAITPAGVSQLVKSGHQVQIEKQAGEGSGFADKEYQEAGAVIVETAQEAWQGDMVMKVKEPLPEEYPYFRSDLILFTYLHLAPAKELTEAILASEMTAIAYETVQLSDGSLPLLTPMSEVAGRMSAQVVAQILEQPHGGKGILLSGVPGVERGSVVIIGGGVAGTNAAKIAIGLGANVTILDVSAKRLAQLDDLFGNAIQTHMSNSHQIAEVVKDADAVIGAVLLPGGAKAPKLVSEEMVRSMKPGSVLVDIAVDQGGIFATTDRITTHDDPTYEKFGVVHYAVANMPGAVPRTSTLALTNVTMPYAVKIANQGVREAAKNDEALAKGINAIDGKLTIKKVSEEQQLPYSAIADLL
ncbi:alanine dehydrogenase [Listeria grayi]|uniref:Alanine dehydrogenase n=2 Tax=Listeria grayi TaxID=1641 RepID=D7UWX5_LISGR|nr:alanine dehydrogenase [Listeria grayi]EFI84183.1 alanine dehydrogenase [Listeria grayi DSM 20601]